MLKNSWSKREIEIETEIGITPSPRSEPAKHTPESCVCDNFDHTLY